VVAVVVVVGGEVVVVVVGVGGGAAVGGGAGALVVGVGAGVVVLGTYTKVKVVGGVALWCGCVVLGAVVDDVVEGRAAGSTVAAAVLGPLAAIGLNSCTLCTGSRGLPLPGESITSTASRAPTTPRPASIPVRWFREGEGRSGSANSSWMAAPTATDSSPAGRAVATSGSGSVSS
jgi:hypothetical protein